jgi:16S rRNA (uracil1498-N3)-methyltransferase
MNLLLLESAELEELEGRFVARLAGRRAEHVAEVLRAEPGQELRVGVIAEGDTSNTVLEGAAAWPAGARGRGRVLETSPDSLLLEVVLEPEGAPAAEPHIDLALALPRPQGLHRILQSAATMGVGRVDLFRSYRVEKSYFSSPSLRPDEIRRQLLLGAEQGLRTRLPPVKIHPCFRPFVDDPGLLSPGDLGLLAHPGGLPIERAPDFADRRVVLAIGPEGGFIDYEIEAFKARGFLAVDLGPWVLRSEMAVVAGLAQLGLLARARRHPEAGTSLFAW